MENERNNTATIARNSFWLAVERVSEIATSLFTSIAMARALGPAQLGYFTYFLWLTNTAGRLGSLGIGQSTAKYAAEYFGRNQPGMVRTIFDVTLRMQVKAALLITCAGLVVVALAGDPQFRLLTVLLVVSVLPGLVNGIPSQLNNGAEKLVGNVPGTLTSCGICVIAVIATLIWHLGLVGLAVGVLAMRAGEMVVRLVPALRWMRRLPREPLPDSLRRKMLTFSGQGLVLLLLAAVVWDRSEVLFLKRFADIREISFYSVAFGVTQNIVSIVEIFAHGVGVSVMAQFGRDESRLGAMVSGAMRYLTLLALPLFFGLAALSGPVISLMYGSQYRAAIPVLVVSALLAIPRAWLVPVQQVLRAGEYQGFVVRWSLWTGVLNLALDWLLIPRYGAIGAAMANGGAQAFAVLGFWIKADRHFHVKLPWRFLGSVTTCALAMAGAVLLIARLLPPLLSVPVGVTAGALVFFVMLRWIGTLEPEDRDRLVRLRQQVPPRVQGWFERGLALLMPSVSL